MLQFLMFQFIMFEWLFVIRGLVGLGTALKFRSLIVLY
jgi:hypothetical protein